MVAVVGLVGVADFGSGLREQCRVSSNSLEDFGSGGPDNCSPSACGNADDEGPKDKDNLVGNPEEEADPNERSRGV